MRSARESERRSEDRNHVGVSRSRVYRRHAICRFDDLHDSKGTLKWSALSYQAVMV
jgi:hypothetical protein